MIVAFFLFDWFDGVPANVIANAIVLVIGVAIARVGAKVANRRIWSLSDPTKLVIFVAEDSRELVPKGNASYARPATGVGQVRALAVIAPSLRTAYRKVDLRKVVMAGENVQRDLMSDLISLGGAKNNVTTRKIMSELSTAYVLPEPSSGEGLSWMAEPDKQPEQYVAHGGRSRGEPTPDDEIERDYGVIVKAPNPWNPAATVILLYGSSTHGTAAAGSYFVEQRRWRRPGHFTALVEVNVTGGYTGKPALRGMRRLEARAPRSSGKGISGSLAGGRSRPG